MSEAAKPGQGLPLIEEPLYAPLVPSEPTPAERYPAALSTLDAAHRAFLDVVAQRRSELPAAAVTALDSKAIPTQATATRNAARAALSTIFACDKTHDLTVEIVTASENLRRAAPGDRRTATIALLMAQQKAQTKMLDPLNQRLAEDVGLFADASRLLRAAAVPADFDAVVNELKRVKAPPAAPCP